MGNNFQLQFKTSYADGPLCGFSTLFVNWIVSLSFGHHSDMADEKAPQQEVPCHFRGHDVSQSSQRVYAALKNTYSSHAPVAFINNSCGHHIYIGLLRGTSPVKNTTPGCMQNPRTCDLVWHEMLQRYPVFSALPVLILLLWIKFDL